MKDLVHSDGYSNHTIIVKDMQESLFLRDMPLFYKKISFFCIFPKIIKSNHILI